MSTQYPIVYKRGRLVKYVKPTKPRMDSHYHSKRISDSIQLSEIIEWVNENNGEYDKAILSIESDYGSYKDYDYDIQVSLTIPLSQLEKDKLEKDYQQKLKDWNEWKILSKDAVKTEEDKEKEKRLKSLKTQENNLLKQLENVRKQKEKL